MEKREKGITILKLVPNVPITWFSFLISHMDSFFQKFSSPGLKRFVFIMGG